MTERDFEGTGRFQILRKIGVGGMGVVYEAIDRARGARVALKTLREIDPAALRRFKSEFRALADLGHKNLVALGELVEHEGSWFFTMEIVDGVDFLAWVRPGSTVTALREGITAADLPNAETLPAASNPRGSVVGESPQSAGTLDEGALRRALLELADGLNALHGAGKIHRDIKPSNLLVTPDGRVVILDFGLVADTEPDARDRPVVAGTVAYMAPEQATGVGLGPPADWYAVGVVLYEALTGQLPFHGSAFEVLATKQVGTPPRPKALVADLSDELDALCMDLLALDPAARPTGVEVIERIAGPGSIPRSVTLPPAFDHPFVGRRRELGELLAAAARVREGFGVTTYVHGESGVGKTALVRHFVQELGKSDDDILVLAGRCYERESVPFKAVDGVIDATSRLFDRLTDDEVRDLCPPNMALLAKVFPVLARAAGKDVGMPAESPKDPLELRSRVFAVVRELFSRLGKRFRCVLLIDDLQWADADSLLLLRDVMRPPGAPAVLLLATVRTAMRAAPQEGPAPSLPLSRLNVGSSSMPGDVRSVQLDRLGREDALALVTASLGGAAPELAANIAEEAGGHPLFIDELVRHALVVGPGFDGHVKLEDALRARIDGLDATARSLLEVVSIARAPLPEDVAGPAAEILDAVELDRQVGRLRHAHLARRTQVRGEPALETYHDRVRLAACAEVPEGGKAIHRRIAEVLETRTPPDLEALAEHWRGAGDRVHAATHAAEAAAQATARLAFDRAARLYRWSLDLHTPVGAEGTRVLLAWADALVRSGRGAEAADAYLAAADRVSSGEAMELRRRAAHELLVSGHTDAGLATLVGVLGGLGLELPESPRTALAKTIFRRTQLRLRGTGFRERRVEDVPERDLLRVDICFTVAQGLAFVDTVRGAEFQARGMIYALACGEPYRVARALALETAYVARSGESARERWEGLAREAMAIATRIDNPHALALAIGSHGVALHLVGEWRAARERCVQASRIARTRCDGATWEVDTATIFSLRALYMLGDIEGLRTEVPERLADAQTRGDLFAATSLRTGELNFAWLASGDVEGAKQAADEAMRDASKAAWHLTHVRELYARAQIDLYQGDGATAHRRIVEAWGPIERSRQLHIEQQRVLLSTLRARAAVGHARRIPQRARDLLDEATKFANDVARTGTGWALAEAALLRGSISRARGHDAQAAGSFEQALAAFVACEMSMHAATARLRLGRALGGDAGQAHVQQARAWFDAQGVADPEAVAAMLAP